MLGVEGVCSETSNELAFLVFYNGRPLQGSFNVTITNSQGGTVFTQDYTNADPIFEIQGSAGVQPPGVYTITLTVPELEAQNSVEVTCLNVTATPTPPTATPPTQPPPQLTGSGLCTENRTLSFTVTNNGASASQSTGYVVFGPGGQLPAGTIGALNPGQSQTVDFGPQPDGTYSFFTSDGSVTVAVECQEPVICVEPPTAVDENGLPIFTLDPVCADTQLPKTWTPVEPAPAVCVDYAVYHTDVTGDWEIFRLGELPENPTADPNLSQGVGQNVVDVSPSRSPGGDWIVFTSNRDGNWELYIGNVDGTEQRRVTFNNFAVDTGAMWSPLGDRIVFASNRDGNWNLFLLDLATGAETQLTDNLSNEIAPAFTADGQKVVFQSDRDGLWQIYEVNLGTFEQTRLSDGQGNDFDPLPSPNGDLVGFHSIREGLDSRVYVMDSDGANPTPISAAGDDARNLSWSSDQALLAYNSNADGDQDIYVYELATELTRQLTDNTTNDVAPTWLCSAPTILWTSDATSDQVTPAEVDDIYETNALPIDGPAINVRDDASRLTDNEHENRYPQNFPPVEFGSRASQQPPALRGR